MRTLGFKSQTRRAFLGGTGHRPVPSGDLAGRNGLPARSEGGWCSPDCPASFRSAGSPALPSFHVTAGLTLVPVLVYLGVFLIIANLATMAFFTVLEHVRTVRHETDQVTTALVAGERWRDDIRRATAPPQLLVTTSMTTLLIPRGTNEVGYLYQAGQVFRRSRQDAFWQPILGPASQADFIPDTRAGVPSWRWEVRFPDRRGRPRAPLAFTFQAVPLKP